MLLWFCSSNCMPSPVIVPHQHYWSSSYSQFHQTTLLQSYPQQLLRQLEKYFLKMLTNQPPSLFHMIHIIWQLHLPLQNSLAHPPRSQSWLRKWEWVLSENVDKTGSPPSLRHDLHPLTSDLSQYDSYAVMVAEVVCGGFHFSVFLVASWLAEVGMIQETSFNVRGQSHKLVELMSGKECAQVIGVFGCAVVEISND